MTEYFVEIIFENVDLEAKNIDEALREADVAGAENFEGYSVLLGASLEAPNALATAKDFIAKVRLALPEAKPLRVARNLVNIPEIAERVGVSRQAVRNWSSGERRDGSFPMPIDIVGEQKIWEWGAVNAWLRFNLGLDDGLYYPTPLELGEIDAYIKGLRTPVTEAFTGPYPSDIQLPTYLTAPKLTARVYLSQSLQWSRRSIPATIWPAVPTVRNDDQIEYILGLHEGMNFKWGKVSEPLEPTGPDEADDLDRTKVVA